MLAIKTTQSHKIFVDGLFVLHLIHPTRWLFGFCHQFIELATRYYITLPEAYRHAV